MLQQRQDYKKARAADNKQQAVATLARKENVNHMPVTHVQPKHVDTNDVEFDTTLFEPTTHDSDDEGWFCISVQQFSLFFA